MEDDNIKSGLRIRSLRKKRGWTQVQLGNKLGVSGSSVGHWETGKNSLSGRLLTRMAAIFNTTESYIMSETDTPERDTSTNSVTNVTTAIPWYSIPGEGHSPPMVPYFSNLSAATSGKQEPPELIPFPDTVLREQNINHADVFFYTATTNSNAPLVRIGTVVGVDTADKIVTDAELYIIRQSDLCRLQSLFILPGQYRIHSHNPEFPDEFAKIDSVEIVGRVFSISTLRPRK